MNTKNEIYDYIVNQTKLSFNRDFSLLSTNAIASELHVSRSLVSQYLNDLYKENKLIKIASRPVYYLDKQTFESIHDIEGLKQSYLNVESLFKEVEFESSNDSFHNVIGNDGSLSHVIQQIKTALSYPNNGLPIVLSGKRGSGKGFLVKLIHQFCLDKAFIDSKSILYELKFIRKDLEEISLLFGNSETLGLLERKDIGVLYIECVDLLSRSTQYLLSNAIRDGFYMKDKKPVRICCRVVFGTDVEPEEVFDYSLLQNLPIVCKIPELNSRGVDEKERFIIKFFKQEQVKLDLKISISSKLMESLLNAQFEQDIKELEKCITQVCVSALPNAIDGHLKCYVYNLPEAEFSSKYVRQNDAFEAMIEIDTYEINETGSQLIQLFDKVLVSYRDYQQNTISYTDLFTKNHETMRNYYDLIIFKKSYQSQRMLSVGSVIDEILDEKRAQNRINIPANCSFVLSRMLIASLQQQSFIERWELQNRQEITRFLGFLKDELNDIYVVSKEISKMIYQSLEIWISDFNLIFLMLNIYFYNDTITHRETAAIIISHGYSTASSIADAANQLLDEHIFDAFDMPLDSSSEEIRIKVNDYISMNPYYKNLILLVDMGSLETIGDQIQGDINVGVLNNISTSIALHIGSMIRNDESLKTILENAVESAKMKYKILNKTTKEKAIVFISDAGVGVADRMVNLFRHSLPKSINIRFLSYDYREMAKNGDEDPIFTKYNVILMVKPHSLPLKTVTSVSLEDIVSFKDISIVDDALSHDLNSEEIEAFNRDLLKNFSLQNVMENLSILNASKLLDFVSDSTLNLERKMMTKFQSKTIVGIYIHVCFLVERLVTKTAIDDYDNLEQFEKDHASFVKDVNDSFGPMLAHYNVKLPISEVALLYDYIINDRNRQKEEGDLF